MADRGFFSPALRELRVFLAASFAGGLSDPFTRFGISWYVLKSTDSIALFAAVFVASSLVEALAGPFLAPISDHFNRVVVFRICTVLSALLSLCLLAAVVLLPFSPLLLAAIITTESLVAGLRNPTIQAALPHLVEPSEMTRVASLRGMFNSLLFTGGPVLAGAVLAASTAEVTLAAASVMEVLGVVLAFSLRRNASLDSLAASASWAHFKTVWGHRIAEGMRSLWLSRAERTVVVTTTLIHSVFMAVLVVVLPVWAIKHLGGSAMLMAQMEFSLGLGMLLGSTWLLRFANYRLGRYGASVLGPAIAALALFSAGLFEVRGLMLLCLGIVGAGFSIYFVNTAAVRAAATPAHFRSRLVGAFGLVVGCGGPLLMQTAGIALEHLSVSAVNAMCAAVVLVGAVVHARNEDSRSLLKEPDALIEGRYSSMYPKAFVERRAAPQD
jgi:MFS transporter, DHA3 family, macrolide efflux protein